MILLAAFAMNMGCSSNPASGDAAENDTLHFLVPYDSIGMEMGDPRYMFGSIGALCTFPDGSIGVLDRTTPIVIFYTNSGEYAGEFAPLGSGPGEFQNPAQLGCDESGNIMITSANDRKIAWFSPTYTLLSESVGTSAGMFGPVRSSPAPDLGCIAISTVMQRPDSMGMEVALYRGSEQPVAVYRRRLAPADQSGDFQNTTNMLFTADRDGTVFIADRSTDAFSIACCTSEGDTLYCIDEPYEPERRTTEEIEVLRERARQYWISATGSPAGFTYEPPEYHYSMRDLSCDGAGRLWVRASADPSRFRVYDKSGSFLYDCSLRMPDWQETRDWTVIINPWGIVACTSDPERFPVVYMMEEIIEIVPR